jgi:hypothetical protein
MKETEQIFIMSISSLSKYALGAVAAAGILAGCSNGGQTGGMGASGVTPAAGHGLSTSVAHNGILHAISGPSRVSPDKKAKGEFAYISDSGTNTIYVYDYSSKTGSFGSEVGSTTTSLSEPQGACSHKKDAWVTNTSDSNVLEFVNGSTTSSGSLSISGEYPVGCSVDKKGDIAVSDIITTADGAGNVEIFKGGKGTPTSVTCPNLEKYYFISYDTKGNIWVDGTATLSSTGIGLCEIPKGATSGTAISLSAVPGFPGGVTVAGKDIDILDQDAATIDQYTVSGTTGTEVGTVTLSGVTDPVQDWQAGKFVLTANAASASATSFAYPAGGSAVSTVSGLTEPIGVSVSK